MAKKEKNRIYLTESEFNNMISEVVSLLLEGRTAKWNYEACYNEAKKYTSKRDFRTNSPYAYVISSRQGWLGDYYWLNGAGKWDRESCYDEAKKYKFKGEFKKNAPNAYENARKNGWLDDYTWFVNPQIKWDRESCYQAAKKCKTKAEFYTNFPYAYQFSLKNGWFGDYTWLPKPQNKWNRNSCYDEAKKYTSKAEFQRNNHTAYTVALKNGWLDDYTWFKRPSSHNKKWDYEMCYKEAQKYKNRAEFFRNSRNAYEAALRNNWLDEYTWFKRPSSHNKKWDMESCYQEAKKYRGRVEFYRNSPSAYNVARKNGWLDDYTWLNKPVVKKTKNISLEELKSLVRKEVDNLFEDVDFFYSSYESDEETLEYIPGENSDLTDEEYDILQDSMLEAYPITFRKRGNGNDNYNDPYGYEIETDEDDVDKVYADIDELQPKDLSDKILNEFNEWLSDKNPFE